MVLTLVFANVVSAEGCNIVVSCTIPEVPGVNAPPLLEKETLEYKQMESMNKEKTIQEDTQVQLKTISEQKEETNLAQHSSPFRLVRTIYSR